MRTQCERATKATSAHEREPNTEERGREQQTTNAPDSITSAAWSDGCEVEGATRRAPSAEEACSFS
jgi:hypothetical protein